MEKQRKGKGFLITRTFTNVKQKIAYIKSHEEFKIPKIFQQAGLRS